MQAARLERVPILSFVATPGTTFDYRKILTVNGQFRLRRKKINTDGILLLYTLNKNIGITGNSWITIRKKKTRKYRLRCAHFPDAAAKFATMQK